MTTIYNTNEYIFYMGLLYVDRSLLQIWEISPLCVYDRSNCKF